MSSWWFSILEKRDREVQRSFFSSSHFGRTRVEQMWKRTKIGSGELLKLLVTFLRRTKRLDAQSAIFRLFTLGLEFYIIPSNNKLRKFLYISNEKLQRKKSLVLKCCLICIMKYPNEYNLILISWIHLFTYHESCCKI